MTTAAQLDQVQMTTNSAFEPVLAIITKAQKVFRDLLSEVADEGGFTRDYYVRYLSMQYHLTNGVQKQFLLAAAHPCMRGKHKLRDFLYRFALEEEPHFELAQRDLEFLGEKVEACPLDVALWWAYYREVTQERPFIRLGATCIL
ncbi:MAG: hypothetical protein WC655_21950, partial [Candidatus Hydrogenedentales bacterium]